MQVDRLKADNLPETTRVNDAIEVALNTAEGLAIVVFGEDDREELFSQHLSCPQGHISVEQLEPRRSTRPSALVRLATVLAAPRNLTSI